MNKTKQEESPDFRALREERDSKERDCQRKIQQEQRQREKEEEKRKQEQAELRFAISSSLQIIINNYSTIWLGYERLGEQMEVKVVIGKSRLDLISLGLIFQQ